MIKLKFSLPPSINTAYAGKEIRYKSAVYRQWEETADRELRNQEAFRIEGDEWLSALYVLHIDLFNKNGTKKIIDCANYEKAISDFLGGYVDPITRIPKSRRYKHTGVQRIPGFEDHKIVSNHQKKIQKGENEEPFIEVFIDEVFL